jgi:hypothetical protein
MVEMLKFKKLPKKKWWKPKNFLLQANPLVQSKYSTIDNIFLSYKLVEHYFSQF